jgi:riboflavin kinase/FMN adenylyltransferase
MRVFQGHQAAGVLPAGGAVALGNFDGVHKGHQELVRRARAHAQRLGGPSLVLTFEPHPTRVLAPQHAPPLILPLEHRLELLAGLGLDATILEPFTLDYSKTPAESFVRDVLAGALRVHAVVVGFNFTFGHRRGGNPELLATLGTQLGFGLDVVPEVLVDGQPCNSTRIRALLAQGDAAGVTTLLGRPFGVRGEVVHGHHRGRTLGFPTANVEAAVELLPALGVYAARVTSLDGRDDLRGHPAVVNVGVSPTFDGTRVTVESHLLDFREDLYGRRVEVAFVARLRAEQRFSGVDALKAQITQDAAAARAVLGAAP